MVPLVCQLSVGFIRDVATRARRIKVGGLCAHVERMRNMKYLFLKEIFNKSTWREETKIIGVSCRTMRRLRERLYRARLLGADGSEAGKVRPVGQILTDTLRALPRNGNQPKNGSWRGVLGRGVLRSNVRGSVEAASCRDKISQNAPLFLYRTNCIEQSLIKKLKESRIPGD